MPELPEIHALSERLEEAFGGQTLVGCSVFGFSGLKTVTPSPDDLVGRQLATVGHRGKFLVWAFGDRRMLVHLSQAGRVDLEQPGKATKPRGSVVRFTFDDGACLIKEFGTERKAGWWVLSDGDEGPLAKLGPEPGGAAFAEFILSGTDRRRLHTVLRDQRTVAGIGRGYTDDILNAAQLSPFASLDGLSPEAREGLLAATTQTLEAALAGERERTGGLPPKLGQRFRVHGHQGDACPLCSAELHRVSYESYELIYCPACQSGGKLLADRRMSRLLK